MRRRFALSARWFAAFLAVGVVLTAASAQGRTAVAALLFIPQVVPSVPVKPQTWFAPDPVRSAVAYPTADGAGDADLYAPAGEGVHSGVLLFLGVNPAGKDDPRVVNLAEGLARAGMVVLIPWSDDMTEKRVSPKDVDNLVRAYEYLLSLDGVDAERSGMGGFCVGASFAAVAAADERVRDRVRFVNFFGGYYDARDLVAAVASQSRFDGDDVRAWTPAALSQEVVTAHLIEGVARADERERLASAFIARDSALSDADAAEMSAEALAVYRLVSGGAKTPREARALIAELSEDSQAKLAAISPSSALAGLSARVLIMHDREDALVPSEESRRLAAALAERGDFHYTEFSLFRHLDPTRAVSPPVYAREIVKLYAHMYRVLRESGG